jgi:5-methyltetrahydrofolate--homocysteine methyltransferase
MEVMADRRLLDWLEAGEVVLGDGAMGTMLQAAGHTDGSAPELWNVNHPEQVRAIHEGYLAAGSRLIETNTFGGTRARLQFHQVGDRTFELNQAGAALAKEAAAQTGALAAGSIGPTGELIEPVGPLGMDEAAALFAEQARGLVAGGVDLVLIETMSHLNEVEAAIRGVRAVAPDLFIAATLSFDTNGHTMMGVSPRQALDALHGWGIRLIGANCGNGPAEIERVMTQMAQARPAGVYLIAQSNAGLPRYQKGKVTYDGTPEVMAEYALKLRDLGVNVIGACCGSTPAHIAAMGQALAQVKGQPVAGPPPAEGDGDSAAERAARGAARRQARHQQVAPGEA